MTKLQPLPPLLQGSGEIQRKSDNYADSSKEANVYTTANKDKVVVRKVDKAEDRKFYNPFKSPYPIAKKTKKTTKSTTSPILKTPPMSTKKPQKSQFPSVPGRWSDILVTSCDNFLPLEYNYVHISDSIRQSCCKINHFLISGFSDSDLTELVAEVKLLY